MNALTLITTVALVTLPLALSSTSAESKAYDVVQYKGKAAGLRITFEFADGYPEASHLEITESASGKPVKFVLANGDAQSGTGKMRFVPEKGNDKTKEVSLQMEAEGDPPSTVRGTYAADGKSVRFTLARITKD
jgi:hypothetical protein